MLTVRRSNLGWRHEDTHLGGGGGSTSRAITDPALDVQMLHPMADAEVTDIGLSFPWYRPNHFVRDADGAATIAVD